MKKNIVKKLISVFVCISLFCSLAIPAFAAYAEENGTVIYPDTIITQNNIIAVMDYLGLDTDKLILEPQAVYRESLTVAELQQFVNEAKIQNTQSVEETQYIVKENPLTRSYTVRTKTVSAADKFDSYTVTYSAAIKYEHWNVGIHIWEEFLEVTNMDATISGSLISTTSYAITRKSFNGSVKDSGKTAEIFANIDVTSYVNVVFAKIPTGTTTHKSTHYFYAQTIN